MSYVVFARKYRPQRFDDVAGQPHITATLKNAISQARTAHAYIFAGPRGVGKTTTARILARALNCEKGPTVEPCGKCGSCQDIMRGSSLDVLEIDGASNRGIDEIRNLRENVRFSPSKGKFKIYIIDEVHMLTEPAFNALLKTLEEPPAHVKFIFATTQCYKVPATILSRCQRFDFKRIASKDMLESLKVIAAAEGLKIKDEALGLIARHSDGSMRDAQVLLDQMASFAAGEIAREDISKVLGIVGDDLLFEMSSAIKRKDALNAVRIIGAAAGDGRDMIQLAAGLIEHFRNILVAKIGQDLPSLIDAGADRIRQYEDEARGFTQEEALYIIYTLSNAIDLIRKTKLARIPLEAAVIKLTRTPSVIPLAEIMKTLESATPVVQGDKAPYHAHVQYPKAQNAPAAVPAPAPVSRKTPISGTSPQLDEILASWAAVIEHIKQRKMSVASYLQEGYPVSTESDKISIGFPKEFQFHRDVLDSIENRRLVEDGVRSVLNRDMKVLLVLVEPVKIKDRPREDYFNGEDDKSCAEGPDNDPAKESDPIVKTALEIFGGEVAGEGSRKGKLR